MFTNVSEYDFKEAFKIRKSNFSYEGLNALYEYLTNFEEETDKEIELDVVEYSTKKDEKNLYKIVDKLEQRITTQEHNHTFLESRVDGLDKDIDAITKVLTKMKSELYYTQKEDQDLKDEIEKAEIKRDQDAKAARDNAEARKIMKNVTNKEDK